MSGLIGPKPEALHPIVRHPRIVFLKPLVTRPNIEVGEYTYYDDAEHASEFENRNVLYHFDFAGDRLIIGKFCALATGVRFLMGPATHEMHGFSTYPFHMFGKGWEAGFNWERRNSSFSDTVIGNDVWIGLEAVVMPGVHIGNGAVVGARALVTKDVPAYGIVGGTPARLIRRRFDDETIAELEAIAWWDWSAEKITRNLNAIRNGDIEALRAST